MHLRLVLLEVDGVYIPLLDVPNIPADGRVRCNQIAVLHGGSGLLQGQGKSLTVTLWQDLSWGQQTVHSRQC